MKATFDYPAWRDWHESAIAQYPVEVRLELRQSRARFWRVNENAKSFEQPPTPSGSATE